MAPPAAKQRVSRSVWQQKLLGCARCVCACVCVCARSSLWLFLRCSVEFSSVLTVGALHTSPSFYLTPPGSKMPFVFACVTCYYHLSPSKSHIMLQNSPQLIIGMTSLLFLGNISTISWPYLCWSDTLKRWYSVFDKLSQQEQIIKKKNRMLSTKGKSRTNLVALIHSQPK